MSEYTCQKCATYHTTGNMVCYCASCFADSEAAREKAEQERDELNKSLMAELRDPCGTIWEHAKKLQDSNDSLRAELAKVQEQSIEDTGEFVRLGIAFKKLEAELAFEKSLHAGDICRMGRVEELESALVSERVHHVYDNARKDSALTLQGKSMLDHDCASSKGAVNWWDVRCAAREALTPSTPSEASAWAKKEQEKPK